MRLVKWLLANAIYGGVLWLALMQNNGGAQNVIVFATWIYAVLACVANVDDFIKEQAAKLTMPPLPVAIDAMFDLLCLGALVWFGWWLTAFAFFVHMCGIACAREKAKKFLASTAAPAAKGE